MGFEDLRLASALAITIAIVFFAVRGAGPKSQSSSEYYLGKGRLTPTLLFFTIFSTTFSAFTVVGLPALFYVHGIGAFLFMAIGVWLTPITLKTLGRRLARMSNEAPGFRSPVGLLTSSYSSVRLTTVVSLLTIAVLIPYLVLQVAGIGKLFVSLSGGQYSYTLGAAICCMLVGVYVYRGGATADARTDQAQGYLLLFGTVLLGSLLLIALLGDGGGNTETLRTAGLLSLPGPNGLFSFPFLFSFGVIFTLISIATPQVSQKLMGAENEDALRLTWRVYPIVGTVVLVLAGLAGLYAAANLDVASPDFVIGDVVRSITDKGGALGVALFGVSVVFVGAIIAAAISTIDSLILAITGIITDNTKGAAESAEPPKLRWVGATILGVAFVFSYNPPRFIVDLAQVQLSGLMALLPCLLGPMFGVKSPVAGWLSVFGGFVPLILARVFDVSFAGFDPGLIALLCGIIGLLVGHWFMARVAEEAA